MIVRRQTPKNVKSNRGFKRHLRLDFGRRCAYCDVTEHRWGGVTNFGVDHFCPRSRCPKLEWVYTNLYYACNLCNSIKSDTWPSDALQARGFHFADPCQAEVYRDHLREREDGTLECLTPCGKYTHEHLDLDRDERINWRRDRREARVYLAEIDGMIINLQKAKAITGLTPAEKRRLRRDRRVLLACRRRLQRDAE